MKPPLRRPSSVALVASLAVILAVPFVAPPRSALADDINFVGYQYGPPGEGAGWWRTEASWFDGDQWFNHLVPKEGDKAIFDISFDPQENGIPRLIHFDDFLVTADPLYVPESYLVPGGAATVGELVIREGDFTFQFSNDPAKGSLDVLNQISIGRDASASLTVRGGVLSQSAEGGLAIGEGVNGVGRLIVDGPEAAVQITKNIGVGGAGGEGTLEVRGGGVVTARSIGSGGYFGPNGELPTGRLIVDGQGSTVNGFAGFNNGEASILNGAHVSSLTDDGSRRFTFLGVTDGAESIVTVQGAGSRWDGSEWLYVGGVYHSNTSAHGELNVLDGGAVEADTLLVGDRFATGEVLIAGTDSVIQLGHHANIGSGQGSGSLEIRDGGELNASIAFIGNGGGRGTATVQSDGRLTARDWIDVGAINSDGTLVVENRGIAESRIALVAHATGSTGAATVQGSGSRWSVAETMEVGGPADGEAPGGVGLLTVRNNGSVTIGSNLTTWSGGTVDVSDNGRVLIGQGQIGDVAGGTMLVSAGGVLAGDGTIIGDVFVDGGILRPGHSPGLLAIDGNLFMGSNGVLDMEIGGLVGGSLYDQLLVAGDGSFDGLLRISFINGFAPVAGDFFDLIQVAGLISGGFSSIEFLGVDPAIQFTAGFDGGAFRVLVGAATAVPEPASWTMLALGLGGFAAIAARRRRRADRPRS